MLHAEGFKGLLLFLIAAGIFIPLFHRARIGPVLGFLLVGLALKRDGVRLNRIGIPKSVCF